MSKSRYAALLLLLPVLAGCSLLKKKGAGDGDGDAEAVATAAIAPVDAAPPTPPGPLASNAKAVARYPDEKLAPRDATINFTIANVSDAAGGGQVLAALKKGTQVSVVAERSKETLIVFKDPSKASRDLMGWVNSDVFGPEPKRKPKRLKCGCTDGLCGTEAILLESGDDKCVRPCNQDSDCGGGGVGENAKCDGDGFLSDNGVPGRAIEFCIATKVVAKKGRNVACNNDNECGGGSGPSSLFCIRHSGVQTCELLDFGTCPGGETGVSGVGSDGRTVSFCGKGAVATVTPVVPAATAQAVTPKPAAAKVKCVLPSPPPCPLPHLQSPKGLCQVACPTGDCSACDGTCAAGFCVAK